MTEDKKEHPWKFITLAAAAMLLTAAAAPRR